jgi:DNA polymerase-3 subunit beta
MKVICDREKLREGLAIVNNVIPGKSTKPVLENVCFVATHDALELVGTDLECAVRYKIEDVQVTEPGPVVVPARVTLDFVRDLSGEKVSLSTNDNTCTISSGDDSCELVTMDPDEFPVISRFGDDEKITIQGGNFARLVNRTAFAAALEPGRYAMHGVLVEIEDGRLKLVATDGRRLALATLPIETGSTGSGPHLTRSKPAIVPTKGMQLFCRVISDPLDPIELHFGENQVGLRTKNAEIFARLIDGEFPRYAAVIPAESQNMVEADTQTFSKKLRLAANVTGNEARAVKLKLEKGRLELFGQSVGRGEARSHMEVDYKGQPAEIAFNPDYVLDGLKNCEEPHVRLEFNDKTSPGKFKLGENYIYIVMPITIEA